MGLKVNPEYCGPSGLGNIWTQMQFLQIWKSGFWTFGTHRRYKLYIHFTVDCVLRALVVVGPPMEVELEDLIVSIKLSSTEDALVGPKVDRLVKLLKWYI